MKKFNNREFKIWDYRYSHSSLLIRSRWQGTNIDLIFEEVKFISIPETMNGLEIIEDKEQYHEEIIEIHGSYIEIDNLFILRSEGRLGYIVARLLEVQENNLEHHQSSLDPKLYL